jgi:predicted ArsR family transcriptional regulator
MVETNLREEIPHLCMVGLENKIILFTEIARHPDGLCINEMAECLQCKKMNVWYHLGSLVKANLVYGRKTARNGRKQRVFKVTPYGIDTVLKELKSVCELYSTIKKEMTKTPEQNS